MKIQKILALLASAAVAASMAAVPVSAAEITGATATAAASSAAQVRATDQAVTSKNSVTKKDTTETAAIEMTQKEGVYFGAFYYFDDLHLPEGAAVTSATLTVTKYDDFKDRSFTVVPVALPTDKANTNDIWTAVSSSNVKNAAATATIAGQDTTLSGDITAIFNGSAANAFYVYNSTVENNKRQLSGKAEISVVYSYTEPDNPVAQVGSTKYATLEEALTAVKANGTIKLLDNVTLSALIMPDKDVTITADEKKTITGASIDTPIIAKANVVFDNVDIVSGKAGKNAVSVETAGKSLTIKNAAVTGNVIHGNGRGSSITLDNTQVDGDISTRRGRDAKLTTFSDCKITLQNCSTANSVTYYSDPDSDGYKDVVTIDETSNGGTITDKYVPAEVITMTPAVIGTYTGDDGSTAAAYKASFTSTTGATASFNVANITWTLDGTPLSVADDNTTASVTVTVSGSTEIVYGIIVEGAASGTLAASFN